MSERVHEYLNKLRATIDDPVMLERIEQLELQYKAQCAERDLWAGAPSDEPFFDWCNWHTGPGELSAVFRALAQLRLSYAKDDALAKRVVAAITGEGR